MEDVTISMIKNYDSVLSSTDEMDNISTDLIDSYFALRPSNESTAISIDKDIDNSGDTLASSAVYKKKRGNSIRHIITVDSYYDSVDEYYGVIESIDNTKGEFVVSLKPTCAVSSTVEIKVTFDMDDIQDSDKELLFVGAQLIWLVGKERKINNVKGVFKQGGITNFSKLQFRRTRILSKKQKSIIEEKADEWSEFFAGLK